MKTGENLKFNYTGAQQSINLTAGRYQIECWGASGNGRSINKINDSGLEGKGGYTKGVLNLYSTTELFVYVGGVGAASTGGIAEGGWNGGGCAWATDATEPANGGGGASDVRLIGGEWDSPEGLLSRFIVAGGGGGGGEDSGDAGRAGGGTTGFGSFPGTQNSASGGAVFGKGAHTNFDGGGGGGGWFGGGTGGGSQNRPMSNSTSDVGSASGGSGYALTTTSYIPTGYLCSAKHYLDSTVLIHGDASMPNPNGGTNITGNIGNGYVTITCLYSEDEPVQKPTGNSVFVKVNGIWKKSLSAKTKVNGIWK